MRVISLLFCILMKRRRACLSRYWHRPEALLTVTDRLQQLRLLLLLCITSDDPQYGPSSHRGSVQYV